MALSLWNPDQLLSITGSARQGEIQCSANNTTGDRRRCGWHKWTADPDNQAVQAFLPSLAAILPEDITEAQLLRLAELCICEKNAHRSQKHSLVARWQATIRAYVSATRIQPPPRPRTPEAQMAAQTAFSPTPGSSSSLESPQSSSNSSPNSSPNISPNSSFSTPPTQDDVAMVKPDDSLQLRVAAVEDELKKTQEMLQTALAEKKTLEMDRTTLEDVVKQLSQLSLDQKAVQEEKTALQMALQTRDQEDAERRKRDLAAAKEEKQRMVDEMKEMEGSLEEMRAEMDRLRTRVAVLEGDKEDFGQQLQEMRVELATEKTRVSKLLHRLAVEERKDVGRELAPVRRSVGEYGWKARVQSWVKSMGGPHGVKRPWRGAEV